MGLLDWILGGKLLKRGKIMIYRALWVFIVLLSSSCGWSRDCTNSRSYLLGEERTSTVGSPLIQSGCFAATYQPRGLNSALWQRKPVNDEYYTPTIEKELIYSGREGDTLHIAYREYAFNWTYDQTARPAFFQQLYYDLGPSKTIVFQDWSIDVIESNNQEIRFKVVKEPPREDPFFLYDPKNRYQ